MVPESIEREVLIEAPVEVVWSIVTEPEHVRRWLSDSVRLDLRAGGEAVFTWDEFGSVGAKVERVEPPHLFAFRWVTAGGKRANPNQEVAEGNSTLVEFRLSAEGASTRLHVAESGFPQLDGSEDQNASYFEDHLTGWDRELGELREYVAQVHASA
jgi:uncharacterized protein YndB with AHSA1/START domain